MMRAFSPVLLPAVVLVAAALAHVSLTASAADDPAGPATQSSLFPKLDEPLLHNGHVVLEDRVLSGAQPEGEQAFAALARLGVKTIISVDGARPDAALARKYGMRYVHLPIGYDGVDEEEGRKISKALLQFGESGAVYVHCHHGKHRSAAAVAVACVMNGSLAPSQAEAVLRTFGTGDNYTGLWTAARTARPIDVDALRAFAVDFVEQAKVSDLAGHMVKLDQHWEHLKQIRAAGWRSPPEHPDLDPAHEALQAQEHLRESARLPEHADRPADYGTMLAASERGMQSLQNALRAKPVDRATAERAFTQVAASCTDCHKAHRD